MTGTPTAPAAPPAQAATVDFTVDPVACHGFPPPAPEQWRGLADKVLRRAGIGVVPGSTATPPEVDAGVVRQAVRDLEHRALWPAHPDAAAGLPAVPDAGWPGVAPFVRGARAAGAAVSGWDVREPVTAADGVRARALIDEAADGGAGSVWLAVGGAALAVQDVASTARHAFMCRLPVVLDTVAGSAAMLAAEEPIGPGALAPARATSAVPAREAPEYAAARLLDVLDMLDALDPWRCEEGGQPTSRVGRSNGIARRGAVLKNPVAGCSLGLDPARLQALTSSRAIADAGREDRRELAWRAAAHRDVRVFTVDTVAHHDAGAGEALELAIATATGAAYLRELLEAGLSVATAVPLVEFRFAATPQQFHTIAKLRAARLLWSRVLEATGGPAPVQGQAQHVVTGLRSSGARDPWLNLGRATVAAFAAAAGGAESITVLPHDAAALLEQTPLGGLPPAEQTSRRLARNVQVLLMAESGVHHGVDPAGGSLHVEHLTAELAAQAWGLVQEIERRGGIHAAIADGWLEHALTQDRDTRDAALLRREIVRVGVTDYVDLGTEQAFVDTVPSRAVLPGRQRGPSSAPGTSPGLLTPARDGAAFEALRRRVLDHARSQRESGDGDAPLAPGVRVVALGAKGAPATVAKVRSLLGAAGLQADVAKPLPRPVSGEADAEPGPAPGSIAEAVAGLWAQPSIAVVVCLGEQLSPEDICKLVAGLRSARVRHVVLAGRTGPPAAPPVGPDDVWSGGDALAGLLRLCQRSGFVR